MKVLIIAHGHPDFAKGGGELAAYQQYIELRRQGHEAVFLAATYQEKVSHGGTPFSSYRENEILFHSRMTDFFLMIPQDRRVVWHDFAELLQHLDPDVIHFHHYIHLGVQFVREAACFRDERKPGCKVVLTFHEYLPICANSGQMIKKNTEELCEFATPPKCGLCVDRTPEDVFLRNSLIKSCLTKADVYITPSNFLRGRLEEWGVPKAIHVIENGQESVDRLPPRALQQHEGRSRFAYLGQINRFKGLHVLLDAMAQIVGRGRHDVSLAVYGSGLDRQPEAYQTAIRESFDGLKGAVEYKGGYEPFQLRAILAEVDTVVVPSIWWENSPLVIQEAFKYGRPVVCSDIGGMREKVSDGIDGRHFSCRSAESLMRTMLEVSETSAWDKLHGGIETPMSAEECYRKHMELYLGEG